MILSIAILVLVCLIVEFFCRKLKIPGLIGMLTVGALFSPYFWNLLPRELLGVSAELRILALIIILLRAGLELCKETLKRVLTHTLVLAFIPPLIEGLTITVLAPKLVGLSYLEAALLGTVIAAVSPAVVIQMMVHFIENRKGTRKGIPTMLLGAASLNDVLVLVVFSTLMAVYFGQQTNIAWSVASIPVTIIVSIGIGLTAGLLLHKCFQHFNVRATKRLLALLALAVLFEHSNDFCGGRFPFAAILAVISISFTIREKDPQNASKISLRLAKLWIPAEIILFTLVGAQVDISVIESIGLAGIALILIALLARSLACYLCLFRSSFTVKEKLFTVVSYIPKATVQAAIGGAALSAMELHNLPLAPGETILALSVLSIILTAPLGAWAILHYGDKVLTHEEI